MEIWVLEKCLAGVGNTHFYKHDSYLSEVCLKSAVPQVEKEGRSTGSTHSEVFSGVNMLHSQWGMISHRNTSLL